MNTAGRLLTGLIQNFGLLISLAFIYSLAQPYIRQVQPAIRAMATGGLFGAMAIVGMLLRIEMAPGVLVDVRVVVVALAGVFNGVGSGLTAGALVGIYRLYLGGAGTLPGLGNILTAMVIGAWVHRRWGARLREFRAGQFLLLGGVLASLALLWTFAVPDMDLAWRLLKVFAVPVSIAYPLGAVLLGLLLSYLQEERQRLAVTQFSLDHLAEAAVWIDPAGRIFDVNATGSTLSGYPREELQGMSVWQVDASCSADTWPALWKAVREKTIVRSESELRTKDGQTVPVETSWTFIDFEGNAFVCWFLRDVTERKQAEAATQAMARVARMLTETLEVAAVAERIVESVRPLFGARSSRVRLLRPDGSLAVIAWRGLGDDRFSPERIVPAGIGVPAQAAAEGKAVWSADVLSDPHFHLPDDIRASIAATGHRAVLAVPLRVKGRTLGTLSIGDEAGRTFTAAEAMLLQAFADQAAVALDNARLYAEAERRRQEAEEALASVKQLQGLLPICSYCKKVRDDQNYWHQVEIYVAEHSEAQFSHGICPECYEKFTKPELESLRQTREERTEL